jgi:succinyl-CoA synthetase alpha subunit
MVQSISPNTHAMLSERLRPDSRTTTIGPNCPTVILWEGQILIFGLSAKV